MILSDGYWKTLQLINDHPGLSKIELMNMDIGSGHASFIRIKRLQELKFIEYFKNEEDMRTHGKWNTHRVIITERGKFVLALYVLLDMMCGGKDDPEDADQAVQS